MSVRLMSAVFEFNMPDLRVQAEKEVRTVKASTAKLVLLAIADHANDYGKSSYPSITTLGKKTAIRSRSTLVDAIDALEDAGFLSRGKQLSEVGTTEYTLHMGALGVPATEPAKKHSPATNGKAVHPPTKTSPVAVHESSFNHQIKPSDKDSGEKHAEPPDLVYEDLEPKKKPTKKQRDTIPAEKMRPMSVSLGKVMGWDMKISSNWARVSKLSAELILADYTPETIEKTYGKGGAWYAHDWRGKKGNLPDMGAISQTIGSLSGRTGSANGYNAEEAKRKALEAMRGA